ncbi:MAG: molybdopterin molybdenumtransferase MoeA [Gemmatimonas sp.]|nr:molybdopterin molybdenumtransferase MoeA [Gemmatimonas sp.]
MPGASRHTNSSPPSRPSTTSPFRWSARSATQISCSSTSTPPETSKSRDERRMRIDARKADWLNVREAVERVVAAVPELDSEEKPIREAARRVLATDLVAPVDVPRWTNSAMDGFAVRSRDVEGASAEAPVELPVVDDIPAGGFPRSALPARAAARVMTGAPVPEGADSVIRVEHTDGGSDVGNQRGRVRIFDRQDAGRNLRKRGEDLREGSIAIGRGSIMTPGAIGVAASLGRATLPVVRAPLVALLTSGDELVEVDRFEEVIAGRKIVSSNSYTLRTQLEDAGCSVRYLGIAADTKESLREALQGARGCDALVTSAGISVGEHDHVKTVLEELQTDFHFWRVRIRPGSPFAFGTVGDLGGIPWFGLPGNPVSSMVTFEILARPALLRMAGHTNLFPATVRAHLEQDVAAQQGLTQFVRVQLTPDGEGGWTARTTGPQGSGILRSLAEADGLLIVPDQEGPVPAGANLPVIPLDPTWRMLIPNVSY